MRTKPPASIFGRRLREARLRRDIPQDKLGVMVGLDEGTASARISRYETGTHAPPFDMAVRLAEVLDVPPPYFYCEDDDLAMVILAWGQLSQCKRSRVQALIEQEQSLSQADNINKVDSDE
ncbi:helix-turn-helix transcriptional regulator [Chromobacterium violaceum]|uniref:helix-turn-helix domain-containing protein n=1 Tax=Chromobacterium violaceum TaxID=536 RepID=UPI001B3443C8|nr:helix-turn-helix transcriptional regulator [Chromobacterium violaceum]